MASRTQKSVSSSPFGQKGQSSNTGSATFKPTQKVFGFLKKRSATATTTTMMTKVLPSTLQDQDQSMPMVVPSFPATEITDQDMATSVPVQFPNNGTAGKINPLKNIIRRKSLELGRLFEGSTGPTSSTNTNNSKTGLDLDALQNENMSTQDKESSPTIGRMTTPILTAPPRISTRRPTFNLGLPWRPQSEYLSQGSPGVQTSLSKTQKRFIRAFPELADLAKGPSTYCLPCLATPPHTPLPDSPTTPNSASMSPSDTLNTLTSSAFSTVSSNTTLACTGHFHDYSCALEREILWQGTLYVTATHVCFYGKHFGKTVKVIIDYQDLVLMEREKKMGVFPSSIRLRVALSETSTVRPKHAQDTKVTKKAVNDAVSNEIIGHQPTKDYVITSLMSREQAFADIEKNWKAHHQFQRNVYNIGLPTPQAESPGCSSQNITRMSNSENGEAIADLNSRVASLRILDRNKSPRTYSMVTDEAFSSPDSENLDRPRLREKTSTSIIRSPTPMSHESIQSWAAVATVAAADHDHLAPLNGNVPAAVESRRGSVASVGSSDKQEPAAGFIGFLQRRSSLAHKWKKGNGGGNMSDSDTAQDHQEDITQPFLAPPAATTATSMQSITIQDPVLATKKQDDCLKSSTPPPVLISPSLTTTKISRSLPTVQLDAKPVNTYGLTKQTSEENNNATVIQLQEKSTPNRLTVATASSANSTAVAGTCSVPQSPQPALSASPVSCGCSQHYKNVILSTVVALPVDLCFEILFSGLGAGLGDKLTCDTHRLKEGSTDILIMPWQHENLPEDPKKSIWVDQQRKLEYSVFYKVPMLAKASTACFETQKVIQFSPFAILVHSESKTPNVLYGEHFSTVNQICMTWESEGHTRIKCFTEVKFKRSIMWSSKIEAGALEGSGGYYKEFISQFEQLVESQGEQLLRHHQSRMTISPLASSLTIDNSELAMISACTSESDDARRPLSPRPSYDSIPKVVKVGENSSTTTLATQGSTRSGTQEMSRAHSLLSQQYNRSLPLSNPSGLLRLSLDSARPAIVGTSTFVAQKSPLSSSFVPIEKKSALSILIQSMTPPTFPIIPMAPEGPVIVAKSSQSSLRPTKTTVATISPIGTSSAPSGASSSLWTDLVKKSVIMFGRNSSSLNNGMTSSESDSPPVTPLMLDSPTSPILEHNTARSANKAGSPRVSFASTTLSPPSNPIDSSEKLVQFQPFEQHNQQDHYLQKKSPRRLSKIIFGFIILGLIASVLNIWRLFTVVSSMVEVVQLKENVVHCRQPILQSSKQSYHPPYRCRDKTYQRRASSGRETKKSPSPRVPVSSLSHRMSRPTLPRTIIPSSPSSPNKSNTHNPQRRLTEEMALGPLRVQTAILRTEISELFDLLEQARKELHHHHHHHRS
ncbi:hypothetical protein FBU30_004451 [Linnemannia zychae]|nr:hypothetical protein FBU30_004451 [Linnemannia zychae]